MNGFSGVVRFDGVPVDPDAMARCLFRSPLWEPDHQAVVVNGATGFTCTQRFITPECSRGLMPHTDPASGCVVLSDSFLTRRDELARKLDLSVGLADCELILAAYLKWGADSVLELNGDYSFVIQDPRNEGLFAAVDPFGMRPFYYARTPSGGFVFANTMEPFRVHCERLTVNEYLAAHYSLDALPAGETCYNEVKKIPAAHRLAVTRQGSKLERYWRLKNLKRRLPHKTREEYYEAFRDLFASAVSDCLRTEHGVMAQISGGLDSSSVACQAAKFLSDRGRYLLGFTAIPFELEGPSHQRFWNYHEMPLVETVLAKYPNIKHHVFRTDPLGDPLADQAVAHHLTDVPYRNVANMHWAMAAYDQARLDGARVLLVGDCGNATISWWGQTPRDRLSGWKRSAKTWWNPARLFEGYFDACNPKLLGSAMAKRILRERWVSFEWHHWLLGQETHTPYNSAIRHPGLWHGVEVLDPTNDLRLIEFSHNAPGWVFMRGTKAVERRLLVREALAEIVPEAVRSNINRGEQAADWHLQYNTHRENWRQRLLNLSPGVAETLWRCYDRRAILGLFDKYPHVAMPDKRNQTEVGQLLMLCLSLAFFLDHIERNRP